jgi:hypothetical protein
MLSFGSGPNSNLIYWEKYQLVMKIRDDWGMTKDITIVALQHLIIVGSYFLARLSLTQPSTHRFRCHSHVMSPRSTYLLSLCFRDFYMLGNSMMTGQLVLLILHNL